MGREENQNQVSLSSHRPWKSLRDSHIPTAPTTNPLSQNQPKKGGPAADRFAPAFRLILGLENASTRYLNCVNIRSGPRAAGLSIEYSR